MLRHGVLALLSQVASDIGDLDKIRVIKVWLRRPEPGLVLQLVTDDRAPRRRWAAGRRSASTPGKLSEDAASIPSRLG